MPYEDSDEDVDWSGEDWSDDEEEDEPDDEQVARCPECGGPVAVISEKCPFCGYWLSADDRRMEKPRWLRVTAWMVLIAFLASLLAAGLASF